MGPERNNELFDAFAKTLVTGMANEFDKSKRAQEVLGNLSEEFREMPIVSTIAEPTISAKMHALSQIGFDQMGIAGFNPMSMVRLGQDGTEMQAVAAPAHDRHEVSVGGRVVYIQTRAILIKPPAEGGLYGRAAEHKESDLEFFGLNLYAVDPEGGELSDTEIDEIVEQDSVSSSAFPITPAAQEIIKREQSLVIAKGEALLGATNVFAVRHKEHGIVKLYGISLSINPLAGVTTPSRDSEQVMAVALPNGMRATITVLEGLQFDQALNEFSQATESINISKTIDEAHTRFTVAEQYALRTLMSANTTGDAELQA